jgi:lipopolysaccharide transport system ATP-binding protein
MSQEWAISARGLGKRYRRRVGKSQADSLRDLVVDGVSTLLKGGDPERKAREEFWALRDVSFDIAKGENVGIIGLNGAGKSTLLKVLSRIVTPTTGEARINGRLGALLEVGTGFHQELTGRENIYLYGAILGMSRSEVDDKFETIVDFSEIGEFIDTPVKRYSSGMYVRLAFAVAAHLDPDILLLDEVLAVGDFAFQRKCLNFARQLEQGGATILFVSHNMFSIKAMCPRVIYLKQGRVAFDGPTDEGLKLYESDSRLASAPWFKGTASGIAITDISIRNAKGVETTMFDFGERMHMRIRYNAERRIERPDFRVGINRVDDVHCQVFSTAADGVDISYVEGEGEIELVSSPLRLTSDLFQINLVVRVDGDIACAQSGGSMHVRHDEFSPSAYGVFHEKGEWRLIVPECLEVERRHEHG